MKTKKVATNRIIINKTNKFWFCLIFVAFLATASFGQVRVLEEKAAQYGVDNADKFFLYDEKYLSAWDKKGYIIENSDKYKEFVNIEIINILENMALPKKRMDYAAFVKKQRSEPNISESRIRNFKETGYYIDEYENYVKK